MTKAKRIISLCLFIVAILSAVTVQASAASIYTTKNAVTPYGQKIEPIWNTTLYMKGKRTYTIESFTDYSGMAYAGTASKSDVDKAKNKLRYDICVIEADGSKHAYYGKTSGFQFNLKYNRTYKVYITSYLCDYKTADYGVKAGAIAFCLYYRIKY